jgi:MFS-type transporter involved in bile tolerance (Atg22 family)
VSERASIGPIATISCAAAYLAQQKTADVKLETISSKGCGLERMNLKATRRNEKRKLAAMWFNGVSIASVAIGIFTPVATAIYDLKKARRSSGELEFTLLGSMLAAALLIAVGRTFLNDLEDTE